MFVARPRALFLIVAVLCLALVERPTASYAGDCSGQGQITGENLTSAFPDMPNALQDQPTGFGNASPPVEEDTQGNELNRLFIANDASNLYIGITGNTQLTDTLENTILLFIDTPAVGGTDVLATQSMNGSNALIALDPPDPAMPDPPVPGIKLDFAPEFALAVWNLEGIQTALLHDLTDPMDDATLSPLMEGVDFAVDNSNQAGVNDSFAADPQQGNAATATTGVEFKIPLASLGITNSDTIKLQVLLVGGDGFISNQSLPPIDSGNGGEPCIGIHDPLNADPMAVNDVDFTDNVRFPGAQNVSHTLNPAGMAPAMSPDGTNIPMRYDPDNDPVTQDGVGRILSTQNNFTCFGDAQPFSPIPSGGAEIDQIFVKADFSKLYIGITGNLPFGGGNNDTILVFIDNPNNPFGVNELFTNNLIGGSGALQGMSNGAFGGFKFDSGFAPEVAVEYWRGGSQPQAVAYSDIDFDDPPESLELTTDPAKHTGISGSQFAEDIANLFGVNDIPGDDPINQEALAATARSGVVFSLNLTDIGFQGEAGDGLLDLKIAVGIVSGSGFVSNQWLPPLNPTVMPSMTDMANFSDAPLPLAIPDNDTTAAEDTRTVDMTAASIDRVTDIDVSVSFTHADASELEISLLHVDSGRLVKLAAPGDLMGANPSVTFDSQEVVGVLPNESLLTFNDVDPNGDWTLIVTDTVTGNVGTLDSWGISVEEFEGGAVGCVGQFDAVDNPIDLGDDMVFPGKQFFDLTGANAISTFPGPGSIPTDFSASFDDNGTPEDPMDDDPPGIPAAFGGTPVTVTGMNAVSGTQNNYTCFGNATEATPSNLPGSELDQMRVTNSASRLKVALTGNLENNGNAVVLLLDTTEGMGAPAGVSTVSGLTSPPTPLGGNGGSEPGFNGLTLDAGFTPNYAMVVQHDPTAGVPFDDYNVFLTRLTDNFTRTVGRFTRNSNSGFLLEGIPNQNGSELNQLYVQNDADRLFIGITGNLEANGNTWIVFLQTTPTGSGTNELMVDETGWPTELRGVNCDRLELGMQPNFAIVYQRGGGNPTASLVDLLDLAPGVTVTPLTLQTMTGDNVFAVDNTNAAGVSDNSADDTAVGMDPMKTVQEENAETAIRGVQFAIDRDSLGHTEPMVIAPPADGDPIRICAILASGNGFWSNQTLPGLGGEIDNLGDPPGGCPANFVDLSNDGIAPGQQFAEFQLALPAGYGTPLNFDGADIPAAMDPATRNGQLLATQDNYTQFGNAVLLNPGNDNCSQVALNNENILGVGEFSVLAPVATPAEAASAFNGLEFDIDFADIGLMPLDPMAGPFIDVRLMAVVTGRFGFFSNQFLPSLMQDPPVSNIGNIGMNPGNWSGDLSDALIAPGNQYLNYTLVPGCGDDPVDINADGMVTCADLTAFVEVLIGNNTTMCDVQKANVNQSSPAGVNGLDIQTFIELFIANGGCM